MLMILNFHIPTIISEGIIFAVTGYIIVFLALVLLYYVFHLLSKAMLLNTRRKLAKAGKLNHIKKDKDLHISGEVTAAIALAIYLTRDLHDTESDVLTIKKITRDYSPWNSKIYGLRFYRR